MDNHFRRKVRRRNLRSRYRPGYATTSVRGCRILRGVAGGIAVVATIAAVAGVRIRGIAAATVAGKAIIARRRRDARN
jgi:hypothetical protein